MEYDYVVIGAGSAGCVLANRLSADPEHAVLVIEAGGSDRNINVRVPAAFSKLFKTSRDWQLHAEPDANLEGRELYLPRGKMLGGSSSMNAMIYIRGRREDYDGWANAGCEGWSYDQVLPYFKRSEHNERIHDQYHGLGGELNVADLASPNALSQAFVAACREWGLDARPDFNGASQLGAGLYQVTQRNGRRWSSADAFLHPVSKRPNLNVVTGALVTRIVVERGRAAAVEYRRGSKTHRIRARREVVVSAGSLNSPQLLMLSGIGPAGHLRAHSIEPVVDLPVGEGLQDHPAVLTAYEATTRVGIDDAESLRHVPEYLFRRRGKLSSNVGEAGAFFKTRDSLDTADIQFHFAPAYFNNHGFTTRDGFAMTIGPTLVSPNSRGRVMLRSADPSAAVRVEGNYLSHPDDLSALIVGVRAAREVAAQPALAELRGAELHPGPEFSTDAEIAQYIRQVTEMLYHPVGTCAMGPVGTAVVDPALRVNGVEGLRVADASVMPTIVGGNTNAPTIMIAEKAADLIRSAAS